MFGLPGTQELLFLMLIIAVLSMSGLWPTIIRGLRELRGDVPPETDKQGAPPPTSADIDLSCKMLGVSPSSSWDEIEKAYRRKAKIHHPDHGGDEDTMRALNDAYSTLKKAKGKAARR